ncbi:MAG: bifunctional DNA-formamidopyrimidine glycosylase/DNA-(apurinic or apyrimidinic site) lyase [Actinomycetes bacterium]|jgi:formamidopyrimidine-DNA glycosylase
MPELPEVETVRAGLAKYVTGKRILQAADFHPRAVKPTSIAPLSSIVGSQIKSVNRRGKFLWLTLDRPLAIVAHLGMSGQLLVQSTESKAHKHLRASFLLSGSKFSRSQNEIRFVDQRTFGWVSIEEYLGDVPTSVAHIAIDPFEDNFDLAAVVKRIRSRKSAIKPTLLNQEIISGIGNIYADESLWRAKIHPEVICEDLSNAEVKRLIKCAIDVMSEAISAGGTSFDEQYKNVNGESGYFERSLAVYGQEGEPCPRCGTAIARIAFANRSSHFCQRCQR